MFPCLSPANFKRPIVILGPLNDIAMEKLARELPDDYEVAGWYCYVIHMLKSTVNGQCPFFFSIFLHNIFLLLGFYLFSAMVPRSGGGDSASTVIKLDTVRAIAEKVSLGSYH